MTKTARHVEYARAMVERLLLQWLDDTEDLEMEEALTVLRDRVASEMVRVGVAGAWDRHFARLRAHQPSVEDIRASLTPELERRKVGA